MRKVQKDEKGVLVVQGGREGGRGEGGGGRVDDSDGVG